MKKTLLSLFFAITVSAAIPSAPSDLNAVLEFGSSGSYWARVEWVDNSLDETAFYVERAQLVKVRGKWAWGPWENFWGLFPENASLWQDGTVSTRRSYKYRVRAENEDGVSEWSNEAVLE